MRIKIELLLLLLFLYFFSHAQENIYWETDTIKIMEDITIPAQTCLIIEAGVVVEFQGNYTIIAEGSIKAIGNIVDTICFTINDTTGFSDCLTDTTYYDTIVQTEDGGWGGIILTNNTNDTSVFEFCKFQYAKKPEGSGGVLYINNYHSIIVHNCLFSNNYAYHNGAGICAFNLDMLEIKQNTFFRCRSHNAGGGVFVKNTKVFIDSNIFAQNRAVSYSQDSGPGWWWWAGSGSGIHSEWPMPSGYPVIVNNFFTNNKSVDGVIYESGINAYISNNVIVNNWGLGYRHASGFYESFFINNTIANNYSEYGPGPCGVSSFSDNGHFYNNIVWNNGGSELPQNSSTDYIFNDFFGGLIGEGNIDADPQFTNPTQGVGIEYDGLAADWTLLDSSPCINTGTSDTTGLNLPEFDIAGNPRIFGGRIDMGAYENQSVYVKINDSPLYSKIKLYPNPGTDKIYIDIPPQMDGAWIDIVDGQGRVIMHKQITYSPAVLSPYKLIAGIYFYRIYNENKVVKSGKWIKR